MRDANAAQRRAKHTRKDITNTAADTAPFAHHGSEQIQEREEEEPGEAKQLFVTRRRRKFRRKLWSKLRTKLGSMEQAEGEVGNGGG